MLCEAGPETCPASGWVSTTAQTTASWELSPGPHEFWVFQSGWRKQTLLRVWCEHHPLFLLILSCGLSLASWASLTCAWLVLCWMLQGVVGLQALGALCLCSPLLLGVLSYELWWPQSRWTLSSVSSTQGACLTLPVLPPCAVETLKTVNWGNLRLTSLVSFILQITSFIAWCPVF